MSSQRYQEFIAERTRLLERIKELENENAELRKRLGELVEPVTSASNAMQNLSLQEKIDVFCSLFKGRDDVFARRWYSKTSEKAGYQPLLVMWLAIARRQIGPQDKAKVERKIRTAKRFGLFLALCRIFYVTREHPCASHRHIEATSGSLP